MTARVRALLMHPGTAVFALVLVGYAYFYQAGGWNQNSRFDLTRAIVEQGTLRIDRYEKNTGDESRRAGHVYCDKAPGVSVLAVPAWAVVYAGSARPPRPEQLAVGAWLATVTAIGIPSALAVVALMLLARRLGLSRERAAVLALGWGLATLAFPYSTLMYGHQLIAAALITAFALVLGARGDPRWRRWIAIGFLLGAAVAIEYTAALAALPITIYAIAARIAPWRRIVLGLAAGAAAPGIALAAYHAAAFGGPLTLPYEFSTQKHRHQGWFMGLGAPDPGVLAQITFSSYRGLFYAAPWLLLAIPGAVRWWKRGDRGVVGVCVAITVLFLWLNASLVDWQGGWAMGPRYLIPAIPFLVVLAGGVLLPPTPGWRYAHVVADRRVQIGGAIALAAALALSAGLMLIGTAVKPEVDVHVRRPYQEFLVPHFSRGELGVSTQGIDMAANPARARRQAWNLGHQLGLDGRASLAPLVLMWIACGVWLGISLRGATRRDARHEPATGVTH
jgi:hypothetical protein